ncbi:hypothetical protein QUC31_015865 [Theobroma cacao]|uniref:Uncharacterized protein LOC18607136 n=2 Tax=Theobroma cacao TaxID=3641 RepID=A0AB32VHT2_THECC|nr:PREDICTED: uncharacterized protein LOC18607136 [Theobroma cacao]EOX97042.1 Uncharacterized protein TCM_006157 [Theobroma cacao]WRX14735.1 hypothetical protein QQP08_007222 [Theobroma cacao]
MNGYSKMKAVGNGSSRSMDSSDLMPLPQTPKPISSITPNHTEKNQEINQVVIKNSNPITTQQDSSEQEDEQEGNNEEMFGPKLRRNSSVSSSYALQAAVKRAFSMRRSSSVSERYCRIHDQSVTLASPFDDEELDTTGTRRSAKKKKNSRGKILKAWKKLFGL